MIKLIVIFCFIFPIAASSQTYLKTDSIKPVPAQSVPVNQASANPANSSSKGNSASPGQDSPVTGKSSSSLLMTTYEFGLSLGVLLFGLTTIIMEIYIIKIKKLGPELLVKFIIVTLIITATLFLITAGYDNNQIAPAIGLFGTVAGYLLGRASGNAQNVEQDEK
ncbi:MAG: hypothetical protein ACKOU7_04485 [Ferruginibacter sp.]